VIFASSVIFVISISLSAFLIVTLFGVLNYFGGILIYNHHKIQKIRKVLFWLLICIDIGILIFYKYINFFIENINSVIDAFNLHTKINFINLLIPIGLSYYAFQSIGYLIRINRGFEIPEKNFVLFSSFLLFFPKFISGPVERSNHFLQQIKDLGNFNPSAVSSGLRLILFGAFKKIVIADNLHGPISAVYSNVENYSGNPLLIVFLLQLIYIYCDFSGYTDMALGSAKLLGINLIDNFNRPFMAKTITEFWKRWHISLSSWCNDFIYLPFIIKYRKLGKTASILGILVTFLFIGIWHGANWTFIILGILQAVAIIYEFFTKRYRMKLASNFPVWITNIIFRILVFLFMSFTMVFFFSNSITDAWFFISHLFDSIELRFPIGSLIIDKPNFLLAIGCFLIIINFEIIKESGVDLHAFFFKQPRWIRWTVYYILIALIFIFNSETSAFVYNKF
jgi:D-alanyl-lipoteichoic acid acyltransferase DltB (MBOAT superfamily)